MYRVCIHGRGGQGVVTASELLARAGFAQGHYVQAIPSFGSERTGAPVVSYCRFSEEPLTTRQPILHPDCVIVQDSTLLYTMDPFNGIQSDGVGIINTTYSPEETIERAGITGITPDRIVTVPATDIVLQYLGSNKPSGALLGAFAAVTGQVSLEAVLECFSSKFKGKVAEGNVRAARAAYDWVKGARPPSLVERKAVAQPQPDAGDAHADTSAAPVDIPRHEEVSSNA